MTAAIELRNIKKSYGDKAVLENFNLAVEKGEFLTVVGSSGCGKTTLLKMINGLIKPTEGDILIDGEDIRGKDMIQLRRNIGYAIQGSILFPHMSVEQNIAYVPNLLNKKNKEKTTQAVKKWMKIVGLEEDLKGRYPGELSGGQQQRVGIARALAASVSYFTLSTMARTRRPAPAIWVFRASPLSLTVKVTSIPMASIKSRNSSALMEFRISRPLSCCADQPSLVAASACVVPVAFNPAMIASFDVIDTPPFDAAFSVSYTETEIKSTISSTMPIRLFFSVVSCNLRNRAFV